MKIIACLTFITFFFPFLSFSQTEPNEPVIIEKLNNQYSLKSKISYYLDVSKKLSFSDIKKIPFKKSSEPLLDYQAKIWYKFYLKSELKSKTLIFSPSQVDSSNVYIPYKGVYKKFTLGRLTNKNIDFSIFDKSILYVPTDSVDFSKPFYYDKVFLTKNGKSYADNLGYIVLTNNTSIWKNKKDKKIGYTKSTNLFLAVLCIAFFIFLVNFLVTKDKNFLNYSLYLLFTILIFSHQLSFLVNLFDDVNPLFIDCLNYLSIIMASACYFYFVICFLNVKRNYPKIYPITKYTVIGSVIFALISIIQLLFFPYLKYRFNILNIYNILFLIISILVFIYLVYQGLNLNNRIIIFGSFLLIIGQILSLITSNSDYFIGAVFLEIIVFSSVISIQNKMISYNKVLSETALQKEKIQRENLQELNKLKSRFITNITHEFRTPLTIIQGYVDNLNDQFNDDKKVTSALNTIKQSSNNLLNLVNQMLNLDALENKKLSVNLIQKDIVISISNIVNDLKNMASEKHIIINFSRKPDEIIMDFDAEKLRQVLSNLISNAIKFSHENSDIEINLNKLDHKTLQIEIIDQGYGISKEDVPFIFDRFYQVENDTQKIYQGTGIGLSLTKELVELFKGTINVKSKLGNGTTFTITLPITNTALICTSISDFEKNTPINSVVSNLEQTRNNDYLNTVLIVEDNVDMANYIASCLQVDYKIILAKNGKEGLELAEKNIPDIIITDVMMPILDGFQLTQKLQTNPNTNHIPIVVLTSKFEHKDKLEGISSGADAYLTKPFEKNELLLRMQMLIVKREQLQEGYKVNTIIEKKKSKVSPSDKNLVFLNILVNTVHQHIDDSNFGPKELAKSLAMSDSQLYKKLRAISNTSTAIFIRKVRLEKAKDLLENGDLSVSEVAYATGFNDASWFSRAFKKEFNTNPSNFF